MGPESRTLFNAEGTKYPNYYRAKRSMPNWRGTYRRWGRPRRRRRSRRRCRRRGRACRARPTSAPEGPTSTTLSCRRTPSLSLSCTSRRFGRVRDSLSVTADGEEGRDGDENDGFAWPHTSPPDQPRDPCAPQFTQPFALGVRRPLQFNIPLTTSKD